MKLLSGHQRVLDDMRPVIQFPLHEIHNGNFFTSTVAETATDELSVSFKTPEDTQIHMVVIFGSKSATHSNINEGVTITAESGTKNAIINRNRIYDNDSEILQNNSGEFVANNNILKDATISDSGTTIEEEYYFSNNRFTQGRLRKSQEFVLKKDTQYEFKLISDDGSQGLEIQLNWYEVKK